MILDIPVFAEVGRSGSGGSEKSSKSSMLPSSSGATLREGLG